MAFPFVAEAVPHAERVFGLAYREACMGDPESQNGHAGDEARNGKSTAGCHDTLPPAAPE